MGHVSAARPFGLLAIVAVLAGSCLTARPAAAATLPQERDITLLPGTVELDSALTGAIASLLAAPDAFVGDATTFAPTDVRLGEPWALTSVVGFSTLGADGSWHAEDGSWFGQVLARRDESGAWQAALEGTDAFASLLAEAPDDLVYPDGAEADSDRELLAASSYPVIFPWQTNTAMIYGPLGIHDGGSGWKAVDMATDYQTSLGHSPGIAVAATAGTINYICKDGLSVTIRFGGFLYAHLLNNPGLYAGRTFAQGDELGQLKTGSFDGPCGYASQPSNWSHLHWAFPNADLQVEDWTLSMSTGVWTNGTQTAARGKGWIVARPVVETPPQVWISGNAGIAGATVSLVDGQERMVTADEAGNYSIGVSEGWSGTITPLLAFHAFSPAFRAYSDVLSEQVVQDFEVRRTLVVRPENGATVCRNPTIVVTLDLSDAERTADGSFDQSAVGFELDGSSVLGLSTVRVSMMSPAQRAEIGYLPQAPLGTGVHTVQFTHPEESGSTTDSWSFTAADIACSESTSLSAPVDITLGGGTDPTPTSSVLSAPAEPVLESLSQPEIEPIIGKQTSSGTEGSIPNVVEAEAGTPVMTTAAQTAPSVAPPAAVPPVISGGPLGCLPWGLTCPRTIRVKQ